MKDIISQIFHQCNKFVQLVIPIVYLIIQFGIYTFCFCTYFFKPLVDSIPQKQQKEAIDNKQLNQSKQEYDTLIDDIELLKQSKKKYQQQIKILRQEISWSNDRLTLAEWGKDITLDEYRQKLEDEWNRALEDEDDLDPDDI